MTASKRAEIAKVLAAQIDEMVLTLTSLREDAEAISYHAAALRLKRAEVGLHTCASGLRQQAGKEKGRAA